MRSARPYLVALLALGIVACAGCAGARRPVDGAGAAGVVVGIYRAELEQADRRPRRFRLMLFAELPDRVHAEVISPVGTTELVLDGGGGRIAVAIVRDKVAFVGAEDPSAIASILGVGIRLEELVRAILLGETVSGGYELERSPRSGSGLPDALSLRTPDRSLRLELKRRRSVKTDRSSLGVGLSTLR